MQGYKDPLPPQSPTLTTQPTAAMAGAAEADCRLAAHPGLRTGSTGWTILRPSPARPPTLLTLQCNELLSRANISLAKKKIASKNFEI